MSKVHLGSAPPGTGSPGPEKPGTPEESEKSPERVPWRRTPRVPEGCAPESQKSPKRVRKSGFGLFSDSFATPGALFGDSGGPAPGDSFGTLFGLFRGARETLCRAGPILKVHAKLRMRFRPPPLTPEFLTKDFLSATRSRMELLTREKPGRSKNQRAANGGSDPSWLNLAFLGRPNFESRGPQIPIFKGYLGLLDGKSGRPKNAKFNHDGSDPPICGPLKKLLPPQSPGLSPPYKGESGFLSKGFFFLTQVHSLKVRSADLGGWAAIPAAIHRSAQAGKCPAECFLSLFGHLPKSAFECFLAFFSP